ncbi:cytochrome c biogenesis ATP-binding export protein CcmA [Pseudovibrio japonicus]|uniref:Cytochrome c biogenesis ATP-binding export protein CcmA n=1 Tax=Pseudovibrio japonicus TaxID=366534 RepID=A0ABQ3E6L1_9HYPH|nr:cytochrome c biogenesis ATP-binding export protein CcmA [Pseudovibrio japonicus]
MVVSGAMNQLKLVCQGVACDRGGRRVLNHVDLEVGSGEALIVQGPNGVGKSSLLRVIAGLVATAKGSITLEGGMAERSVAEQSHYFGHLDALKPLQTVLENLSFWRSFFEPADFGDGKVRESMSELEALDTLGIAHTASLPAGYLSAGQRRRLSVARLLVVPRPIWLLDEPTSALDKASEEVLLGLIADHIHAGGLVVAATHLPLNLPNTKFLNLSPVTTESEHMFAGDDLDDYFDEPEQDED